MQPATHKSFNASGLLFGLGGTTSYGDYTSTSTRPMPNDPQVLQHAVTMPVDWRPTIQTPLYFKIRFNYAGSGSAFETFKARMKESHFMQAQLQLTPESVTVAVYGYAENSLKYSRLEASSSRRNHAIIVQGRFNRTVQKFTPCNLLQDALNIHWLFSAGSIEPHMCSYWYFVAHRLLYPQVMQVRAPSLCVIPDLCKFGLKRRIPE
ncbi:hypothetical protein C8J57DRAFT_1241231 [Mycena rebaudengoi]|nr:hypothetical protein C8J57DRAFT_1241231 [Mycena rebaudengoi]